MASCSPSLGVRVVVLPLVIVVRFTLLSALLGRTLALLVLEKEEKN